MQHRRQEIIDILKQRGQATVEELSSALNITSVTVRHHLDVLRSEGLVSDPIVRHRSTSGRPQHVYALTAKAERLFPHNYQGLAQGLLAEIQHRCDNHLATEIFEGVAARLGANAPALIAGEPLEARVEKAVEFLNQQGYAADWERRPEGILIHTCNCPFEGLPQNNPELCLIDLRLISSVVGTPLERVCHLIEGDSSCAYLAQLKE